MKKIIAIILIAMGAIFLAIQAHELVDADKIQRVQNDGYYSASSPLAFGVTAQAIQRYLLLMASPCCFVMIGSNASSNVLYSQQGVVWTNSGGLPQGIYQAGVFGDKYVTIATNTSDNFTSTDGFNWVSNTFSMSNARWWRIGYSAGLHQYIALPKDTGCIAVTTNAMQQWNTNVGQDISLSNWTDLSYGTNTSAVGMWIGVGNTNVAAWSVNGTNWFTNETLNDTNWVGCAAGTNGLAIAVQNDTNMFAYSMDFSNWYTNAWTNSTELLNPTGVRYFNGYFYVTLANTNILLYASEKGVTNATNGYGWKWQTLPSTQWWYRIAMNTNLLVVMATNGFTAAQPYFNSEFELSRGNAIAATNIYFLLRVENDGFFPRPVLQVMTSSTNFNLLVGYNLYNNIGFSAPWVSNKYKAAQNDLCRSAFMPGKNTKYYGVWRETSSNAFFINTALNLLHSSIMNYNVSDVYSAPAYLSNNIWYLLEFTNVASTVNNQKVILHLLK